MEEIIIKLKEAAEIKGAIAKQESAVWQKISEALGCYLKYQDGLAQRDLAPTNAQGDRYLDTKHAAEYLGLKYGTLAGWRFYGTGPKYIKL